MNTAKRSKLLAAQQTLPPDPQTIIKTLAVNDSYSSPAKLSKCLARLGLKGDKNGLGLNLTAADYVIHMDPLWNPAVEDQASDRAHRIGQQRPVTIYRLIAQNTIEEKIVALHSKKRDLADSLLEGAKLSGKMSADDLLALMQADTPLSGRNHA